jgi:hypothetical protein
VKNRGNPFNDGLKFAIPITLIMWALFIWLVLLVGGCATCREHPLVCTVAGAIVVGSVAATIEANSGHDGRDRNREHITPPNCAASPASCQ